MHEVKRGVFRNCLLMLNSDVSDFPKEGCAYSLFSVFSHHPPPRTHPSFSVLKANSPHPLLCKNLRVHFLPICHTTHYTPHLDICQTSHVQLHNLSCSMLTLLLADYLFHLLLPKEVCFPFAGSRARPCLLQNLMAGFRQEPFFLLLSSKG